MVRLSRTVRFTVHPNIDVGEGGLGAYYELDAQCVGEPDPATGYLINIKRIDEAVQEHSIPLIARAIRQSPPRSPGSLLPELIKSLRAPLPALTRLRWRLTPACIIEMEAADMTKAVIKQTFEIACAHRLHVESLTDAENQRIFGKCNNPNGHGHNYRYQPAVEIDLQSQGEHPFTHAQLEAASRQTIDARFDHKHLNLDTPEFAGGLNPSVENIARVFFDLLAPVIESRSKGHAALREMTVWETEKTSCTYPAPPSVR